MMYFLKTGASSDVSRTYGTSLENDLRQGRLSFMEKKAACVCYTVS